MQDLLRRSTPATCRGPMESAQAIVAQGRGIPVEADPDLREFSYGEWEGLTTEEAEAQDPKWTTSSRMALDADAFAAPGGENARQLLGRVRRFYEHAAGAPSALRERARSWRMRGRYEGSSSVSSVYRSTGSGSSGSTASSLTVVSVNRPGGRVLELLNEVPSAPDVLGRYEEDEQAADTHTRRRLEPERAATPSGLAESQGKRVLFVATAEAGDADMEARIRAHQASRPVDWDTRRRAARPRDGAGAGTGPLRHCAARLPDSVGQQPAPEQNGRHDIPAETRRLLELCRQQRRLLGRRQQRGGTGRGAGE